MMEFREEFGKDQQIDTTNKDLNLKWPKLELYLKEWQNPTQADKLLKVEKELQEVTGIMKKNLEDLMKRGENIDMLMAKSKDL